MQIKIIGLSGDNVSCREQLEQQVNDFIKDKEVIDIKFQVCRTFLPHTVSGEYQELMYAMVIYESNNL